jgi:hypothetical protein
MHVVGAKDFQNTKKGRVWIPEKRSSKEPVPIIYLWLPLLFFIPQDGSTDQYYDESKFPNLIYE